MSQTHFEQEYSTALIECRGGCRDITEHEYCGPSRAKCLQCGRIRDCNASAVDLSETMKIRIMNSEAKKITGKRCR